jgi:hypothetical protein
MGVFKASNFVFPVNGLGVITTIVAIIIIYLLFKISQQLLTLVFIFAFYNCDYPMKTAEIYQKHILFIFLMRG